MELRLISSLPFPGDVNMAVDTLLAKQAVEEERPVLRFFRWSEPSVTVGHTVPDADAYAAVIVFPGTHLFRRPTGGGILYHADQMSFSLSWPKACLPQLRGLKESYGAIHLAVRRALADNGFRTEQVSAEDSSSGLLCSANAIEGDLISESGAKVVGGAQWRLAGGVLYEGHLWLKWTTAVEEAMAFRLSELLGISTAAEPLGEKELATARKGASAWRMPSRMGQSE